MKIKGRIITAAIMMQLVFIAIPVEAMTTNNGALTSGGNSSSKNGLEQIYSGDLLQEGTTEVVTEESTEEAASSFNRPVIVVKSYYTEPGAVQAGGEFTLYMTLINKGQLNAKNVVLTFSATNFSPLDTGGVITFGTLKAGDTKTIHQSFYAAPGLWGYTVEPLSLSVSYTDVDNFSYSETFNTSISLEPATYIEPTATPTVNVSRPRLLISQSSTDLDILQPGSQFQLYLQITNVGSETARGVNLVVGGATVEAASTDTPGGSYTATGGDFTNFSPLGGSNVQALGDIGVGATFTASQTLIVNVSTNPGVYTLKISLVYLNGQGETLVDDMVITLMVKSIPMIDISFYQEPGDLFTFQPNALPLQIVNIGKKSITLGNMKITSSNGSVENGTLQVGYLDSGGYLTQDALLTPDMAGEVTITVTVNYVDDFNQPQIITQDLTVNVVDMPVMDVPQDMGMNETINQPVQEIFLQKVWRFVKGLFGFDSSADQNQIETTIPSEEGGLDNTGGINVPVPVKGP